MIPSPTSLGAPASFAAPAAVAAPWQLQLLSMQLVPVAPLLLLPFIIVAFVVFAPLWGATLLAIALLRAIFWPIERVLIAIGAPGAGEANDALVRANRWVSTLGGLTERYTASRNESRGGPTPGP